MKPQSIAIKRIYEAPAATDGKRVLVDRIWPRGIKKDDARLDDWIKDLAPSTELRKWFDHDPAKWKKFQQDYMRELDANATTKETIRGILQDTHGKELTLLFGARDAAHNNAVVLKDYIERKYL